MDIHHVNKSSYLWPLHVVVHLIVPPLPMLLHSLSTLCKSSLGKVLRNESLNSLFQDWRIAMKSSVSIDVYGTYQMGILLGDSHNLQRCIEPLSLPFIIIHAER